MKRWKLIPLIFSTLGALAVQASAQDTARVRQEVADTPNSAGTIATRTLKEAGSSAPLQAVPTVVAALKGLGPDTTRKQVAAVVYAAVRVVPGSALAIVRAAVNVAPNAAPEIAAAAVRAVPNPWKEVRYQRETSSPAVTSATPPSPSPIPLARAGEPDFKSTADSKSIVEPADANALASVNDPAAPGDPMTLAEAIVQTASVGSNFALVQGAVDVALYGDPAALFSAVGGVRGNSGVGDAGNSNYANEPSNPGGGGGGGIGKAKDRPNPSPKPTPPVVSQ